MRMFRFSSWISESRGGDDSVNGGPAARIMKKAAFASPPLTIVEPLATAKRKRDEGNDASTLRQLTSPKAKRRKEESPIAAKVEGQSETRDSTESNRANVDNTNISHETLRDAIESQLSLETLLKHDELRLINQEMAKCQIALEQLRRCHLIPYPSLQGTSTAMQNISNGTGPAIIPQQEDARPLWAAPYGVTDGPYTRHYAKWLIPDPSFDGPLPEWERSSEKARAGKAVVEGGRTTRNSFAEHSTPASKIRTQRGSSGQRLHALPSGYTQSKENAGPSILKRADGQMVKLVCLDCKRENFGSTQGFINHCRIAHRREFKSHEEAAVQSGQPIELDEVGHIVGEEKPAPAATGLVHPLIRSAPTDRNAYAALLSRINTSMNMYHQGKLPGVHSIPGTPISTPQPKRTAAVQTPANGKFVASSDTPFLSNLMKSRGFDGNLGDIVHEAKKVVEIEDLSSYSEDSDGERRPSLRQEGPAGLDGALDSPIPKMRMPARAAMSAAPLGRPGSSKGPEFRNSRTPGGHSGPSPRLSFATPINIAAANYTSAINDHGIKHHHEEHHSDSEADQDVIILDGPIINDLSPHTIASNNAPSLVSDDGEYDEGDDDAESSIDDSEGEDEGSDVAEIDFEDGEAMVGLGNVVPRTDALRHRAANTGLLRKGEAERHVQFVSPVKEGRRGKK